MLVPILTAFFLTWLGVLLAILPNRRWIGFAIGWPLTVAIATIGNATVFSFIAELSGGGVKEAFTNSAAAALGISILFFPLNFWLKHKKIARQEN